MSKANKAQVTKMREKVDTKQLMNNAKHIDPVKYIYNQNTWLQQELQESDIMKGKSENTEVEGGHSSLSQAKRTASQLINGARSIKKS